MPNRLIKNITSVVLFPRTNKYYEPNTFVARESPNIL